jgi:endonuclease YncB( thermonuclease family)
LLDAANVQHKARLQGIDAPEHGQPFGTKARDRLAAM